MLQALHRACQDGHPLVRLAAAEGVARHGDPSSREVLTQLAAYVGSYGTLADRKAIAEAQRRLEERLGRSG
jgi:HEAT repeat protein